MGGGGGMLPPVSPPLKMNKRHFPESAQQAHRARQLTGEPLRRLMEAI